MPSTWHRLPTHSSFRNASVIFCMEPMLQMVFMMTVISITSISYVQNFLGSFSPLIHSVNLEKYCFMILQNAAKSFSYFFFSCLRSSLVIAKSPLCEKLFPNFTMNWRQRQYLSAFLLRKNFTFQSCTAAKSKPYLLSPMKFSIRPRLQ